MLIRLLVILIFLAAALSCSTGPTQKVTRLPSGKEIKITSIVKMDFPNSGPALVLNYITDVPIDDMTALLKEVDEVWSVFQVDVERENLKAAAIRATHMEGSFIKTGKGYGFVFVKREDGLWHRLEDKK